MPAPSLYDHIAGLYAAQLAIASDSYLREHSANRAVLLRHLNIIRRYEPFVGQRVLDWGCRHAVDACALKFLRGSSIELHGCDINPLNLFEVFFLAADLHYSQLTHPWQLPYPDGSFDTVIASGVLEHVPNDSESLKELWRILRPDGHLIITFLPNRRSLAEAFRRVSRGCHHRRLYSLAEARHDLLHHGFDPIAAGYHQLVPTLAGGNSNHVLQSIMQPLFHLNPLLERVPLVRSLAANLFLIARRCSWL